MKNIRNDDLENMFDSGEDISDYVDWNNTRKINTEQKRINIDLPIWIINQLDKESKKIGVTRQSIIKVWLSEKIENIINNQ